MSNSNRKTLCLRISAGCLVVALIMGLVWSIRLFHSSDANDIFYKSIDSVVELKAVSQAKENYGTAVFVGEDCKLVTNAHVVTYMKDGKMIPYENFFIRFATEEEYREVELLRYDEKLDLAELQCDVVDKTGLAIMLSLDIDYGDRAYAVGNSMNYGISISEGIIGIPNVSIDYDGRTREVVQADITITSGNSGGALLDSKGKLIGITTFRIKDSVGEVVHGLGFAIPAKLIMEYIGGVNRDN